MGKIPFLLFPFLLFPLGLIPFLGLIFIIQF
jgi:hypothetical protein